MIRAEEKEIIRVKEEDFQKLLDCKTQLKKEGTSGSLTTRRDHDTGEYVLVSTSKTWAESIMESTVRMAPMMHGFDEYLKEEEKA